MQPKVAKASSVSVVAAGIIALNFSILADNAVLKTAC